MQPMDRVVNMAGKKAYRNYRRKGSQMAELPPALIILFFVIFFPLLDLLYMCVAIGAGWYLNQIELREVACQIPPPIAAGVTTIYKPYPTVLPESAKLNSFMGVTEDTTISPTVTQTANANGQVLQSMVT